MYGSGSLDPMLGFNRPSLLENVLQYQLIEKAAGTLNLYAPLKSRSNRDGAVVRALASHQCVPRVPFLDRASYVG